MAEKREGNMEGSKERSYIGGEKETNERRNMN